MKTSKKHQVIILPTKNKSNLFIQTHKGIHSDLILKPKLEYSDNETYLNNIYLINSGNAATNVKDKYIFYHIHVLSDEEIKEDDWIYYKDSNSILHCIEINKQENYIFCRTYNLNGEKIGQGDLNLSSCKKVIATTDTSLKIDKPYINNVHHFGNDSVHFKTLSQIPQDFIKYFIKEYNKGNIITEVNVEYEHYYNNSIHMDSGTSPIFKLKISKDNTISILPVKTNFTKEDMLQAYDEGVEKGEYSVIVNASSKVMEDIRNNWIKENL